MRLHRLAATSFLVVSLFAVRHAEASSIVIGGGTDIRSFGEFNTATYGQTFKTPDAVDLALNSFSFWLNDFNDPDNIDFAGYVMLWDGVNARATGPVLYSSSVNTTTGAGGYERFDFLTGGLLLNPANTYVAFLSASNFFDGIQGTGTMAGSPTNTY